MSAHHLIRSLFEQRSLVGTTGEYPDKILPAQLLLSDDLSQFFDHGPSS